MPLFQQLTPQNNSNTSFSYGAQDPMLPTMHNNRWHLVTAHLQLSIIIIIIIVIIILDPILGTLEWWSSAFCLQSL
jgi:hypothetical protein